MRICNLILIAAFGAHANAETDGNEHHKQSFATLGGGPARNLRLSEDHVPTESRIVGGEDADVGKYPFFVEWAGCGASLIHPDIILSAAHCFPIGEDTVQVGSSRKGFFASQEERGVKRTILQKVKHPFYSDSTIDFDYMVMKLDSAVDIQPIDLNDDDQSPSDGDVLTVIGYGTLSEGGSTSNNLQEVNVSYIPTVDCNGAYNGEVNGNTMMCAGAGGDKDSCQGDSGGPIFEIRNGQPVQVGIVSWGYGCAREEYPGVYSRVSGELEWIQTQICLLSSVKPAYCDTGDNVAPTTTLAPGTSLTPAPIKPPRPAPITLPTVSPIASPVDLPATQCEDSNDTFLVDDVAGRRNCNWLEQNLVNFGYLCKFVEVAASCKVACSACDYFQPRES